MPFYRRSAAYDGVSYPPYSPAFPSDSIIDRTVNLPYLSPLSECSFIASVGRITGRFLTAVTLTDK